ncbi:MAG: hypothetical protein ACOYEW_12165 [Anaerolineae bacterium]|jgi:hypothetical protein
MQVRPTVQTRFKIDLDWWEKQGRSFRVELWSHLCPGCRENFASHRGTEIIDWVDPETAEVQRVDGLWHSLRTCCAERPEFISGDISLMTAIFRLFLANGNTPLSPLEIWQRLARRDPETILRLLVRSRPYYGIRISETEG